MCINTYYTHNGILTLYWKMFNKIYESYLFTNECTSDCLKNNIKIYIKIAPTCFGVVTQSSGNSSSVLPKVTLC